MSTALVYCYPCAQQVPCVVNTAGENTCSVCNSEFCEVIESVPQAAQDAAIANGSAEVFVSSFTIDSSQRVALGEHGTLPPRAQVMIIQESVPHGGMSAFGGRLQLGDFAPANQYDAIMARLLQSYEPAPQPTSSTVIEKLPKLRVSPKGEEFRKATKQHTADVAQSISDESAAGATLFACCSEGDACTVCHDVYGCEDEVIQLPCQHCFHEDCIKPWLRGHNTCPVCRFKFELDSSGANPGSHNHGQHGQDNQAHASVNAAMQQQQSARQQLPNMRGFLDHQLRARPAAGGDQQRVNTRLVGALQARRHEQLQRQQQATAQRLQEVQQATQQQLSELLLHPSDQDTSSPLLALSNRLALAQRAADAARRQLQASESRLASHAWHRTPEQQQQQQMPMGGQEWQVPALQQRRHPTPVHAQGADVMRSPDAAQDGGAAQGRAGLGQDLAQDAHEAAAEAAALARELQSLRQQQEEALQRDYTGLGEASAHLRQEGPRAGDMGNEGRGHAGQQLAVEVDAPLVLPLFSVRLDMGPAPLDMFVQPLQPVELRLQGGHATEAAPVVGVPAPAAGTAAAGAPQAQLAVGAVSLQATPAATTPGVRPAEQVGSMSHAAGVPRIPPSATTPAVRRRRPSASRELREPAGGEADAPRIAGLLTSLITLPVRAAIGAVRSVLGMLMGH